MVLSLAEVMNKENLEYLELHHPELAKAVAVSVKKEQTAQEIYNTVYQKSNNKNLATRVASAAEHCKMMIQKRDL